MRVKYAAMAAVVSLIALVTAGCSSGDDGSEAAGGTTNAATTNSTTSSTTETTETSPTTTETSPITTSEPPTTTTTSSSTPTTSTAPSGPTDPLTGEPLSDNPVLAVKVDNTSFPQFGVADADIIYTEQVEGGLTRLIALFHTEFPQEVGAVRSIRSTDFELLPAYGPIVLVNSGGAPANLVRMRQSILTNVTEGFTGLWRSNLRHPPYNLHANLQTIAKTYGDQAVAKNVGFAFATDDSRLADARRVTDISVTMTEMTTSFNYHDGQYWPAHNGTDYVDNDSSEVSVDNVIVQHVTDRPDGIIDPAGNPSFKTSTLGSGKFTLYRDGVAIEGTWSRSAKQDPTVFADSNGDPVTLHPGKTWIVLAPQTSRFDKG